MLNDAIALALGIATREEMATLRKLALRINELLVPYLDEKGIVLPDFKLEFGRRNGKLSLQMKFPVTHAVSGTRRPDSPWIKTYSGLIKATSPKPTKKLPGASCPRFLNNLIKPNLTGPGSLKNSKGLQGLVYEFKI